MNVIRHLTAMASIAATSQNILLNRMNVIRHLTALDTIVAPNNRVIHHLTALDTTVAQNQNVIHHHSVLETIVVANPSAIQVPTAGVKLQVFAVPVIQTLVAQLNVRTVETVVMHHQHPYQHQHPSHRHHSVTKNVTKSVIVDPRVVKEERADTTD